MLCVAGGTGLAPILSILRGAERAEMTNGIHLYFGVRSQRDIYGLGWLNELGRRNPQLSVHVVSTERTTDPAVRTGLITEAIASDWTTLTGFRAYLCGSPPMVDAASVLLHERGIPRKHLYADAFYSTNP
jgi:ferredoxin-NAD(P)+ reductase (naphthalene dioxygenase ferredoxin-specific)